MIDHDKKRIRRIFDTLLYQYENITDIAERSVLTAEEQIEIKKLQKSLKDTLGLFGVFK